ncbi:MAG: DUF6034 family protein [Clostridiales bacterium]|nr:DUF6034 family protein [Clostridiales bacterium]
MNKKLSILIAACILCFLCAACQPTPDAPIVIGKNDGRIEELIHSENNDPNAIPIATALEDGERWLEEIRTQHWMEDYAIEGLHCQINAQISLPNKDIYPVYTVRRSNFDWTSVEKLIRYFAGDAVGVRESLPTKEDLSDELLAVQRGRYAYDDDLGERWEPYPGQQEEITALQEAILRAAPETFADLPFAPNQMPVHHTWLMPDDSKIHITARVDCVEIARYKNAALQYESDISLHGGFPGEGAAKIEKVGISEADACRQAKETLTALGMQNFSIANVEKARFLKYYSNEILAEGWAVTFAMNDGGYVAADLMSVQLAGALDFDDGEYAEKWRPESLVVFINADGIQSFSWRGRLEIVEELNANVAMMDFENVKQVIRNNLKYGYVHSKILHDVPELVLALHITEIKLTGLLIPVKNEPNLRMLVPAWLVYYKEADSSTMDDYTCVFAVNAIDGSNIDLTLRALAPTS